MENSDTINLQVQDMSGQREVKTQAHKAASWGETLHKILPTMMTLPPNTPSDESIWQARLARGDRLLHNSEIVGDTLQDGDLVILQPEVHAGSEI